jgi:hypothetical protein
VQGNHEREVVGVSPERGRVPNEYEQQLRRQELAAARALAQVVPAGQPAGPRELAAVRRVLTQALFELRRLARDLDHEIEQLRGRQRAPGRAGDRQTPQRGGSSRGGSGPGALEGYEAVRDAIEEVLERWEGRRDQLASAVERRQPRRPATGRGGGVSGRTAGAPARPARPRSRRSRRSPG